MANNNPMDEMTDKEREEAMGLSKSQRMQLEMAGLTSAEIKEIHYKRVAEAIAKEREKLDRLEKKAAKNLPDYLATLLGEAENLEKDEKGYYPAEVVKELQEQLPPEEATPWRDMKDLIMTNAEYFAECAKAMKGEKDVEIPDDEDDDEAMEKFAKDYKEYCEVYDKKTSGVFSRRWMGAKKAWYDWVKGGCKGEKPEDISMLFLIGS